MKEELTALAEHKTWSLVPLPTGCKAIKGRWVFKLKLDADNKPVRFKARVVAKGFQQVYGIDYTETFAPVAKMKSIKLVLSIAAHFDLELKQLDFDTAFLNASLIEDVYMEQPDGFHVGGPNIVCKLHKALYGLKQAPHDWNHTLHSSLVKLGYTRSRCDPCVYFKRNSSGRLIVLCVYVDDTIVAYHKRDESIWLRDKELITNQYKIKDLGDCNWILNMRVTRDRANKRIMLCQEAYVSRILRQYDMHESCSVTNPGMTSDLCKPNDETSIVLLNTEQHQLYRSMVGSLL